MNLEPMLNHLWELSHDAKQYSDLVNLCQKEAINNLPQRIVFNTKQVHNFYYRAGIYLATFYVFSSCDMHYDNNKKGFDCQCSKYQAYIY